MIGLEKQQELLMRIGDACPKRIELLIVGGSAMLFYNFSKRLTKDIDIVALSESDRKYLLQALEKIGFEKNLLPSRINEPCVLTLQDYKVDLFAEWIFSLKVSDGMLRRSREKIEFGNITVSVISPEDIILSKCMTERAGDREDALSIIKETNIKWDTIIAECEWQSKNGKFSFPVYLHDFLDELVHDFKAEVPEKPLRETRRLYREVMERLEKQ